MTDFVSKQWIQEPTQARSLDRHCGGELERVEGVGRSETQLDSPMDQCQQPDKSERLHQVLQPLERNARWRVIEKPLNVFLRTHSVVELSAQFRSL